MLLNSIPEIASVSVALVAVVLVVYFFARRRSGPAAETAAPAAATDATPALPVVAAPKPFRDASSPDLPKIGYEDDADSIANDRPHPIAEPFGLNRFAEGRLIDESVAAAVAH